jgi:hypothetical protein
MHGLRPRTARTVAEAMESAQIHETYGGNRAAAVAVAENVSLPAVRWWTRDAVVALALGLFAAFAAVAIFRRLDPNVLTAPAGNDVWFEGDLPIVFHNLGNRWGDHSRNANHPLFALASTIPVYALRLVGLSHLSAVSVFLAAVAASWAGLLYATLRVSRLSRLDAAAFTAAGLATSAAAFWLGVPECAGLASVTILVALLAAAYADRRPLPASVEVAVSALTLSVTVTHWLTGLLLTFTRQRPRRALQLSVNALAIVVVLWAVQRAIVPSAEFFIGYADHGKFLLQPESGGPRRALTVLVAHSAVMPPIQTRREPKWGDVMTIQHAPTGSGIAERAATIAWICLLALGAASLRRTPRVLRLVCLGAIAGQLALHAVYGEESFLYALSIVPMLLVVAASSVRARARPAALVLVVVFITTAGWTNVRQLDRALYFLQHERSLMLNAGR